jgi:hypothetical protein
MEQSYQRRLLVRRRPDGIAADLEDNFHRFGIRLVVVGHDVVEAHGVAGRVPWTTCPGAVAALRDFEGHDVRRRFAIDRESKSTRHCTHLFDITVLALDHLRLDVPDRDYRISVAGPADRETIRLGIDGREVHVWVVSGGRFEAPEIWRGREVRDLPSFGDAVADPIAHFEHMLMRRALHIGRGRFLEQDDWQTAADLNAASTCISFQPGVRTTAVKVKGTAIDFTGREERLLADCREAAE